MSPRHHSTAPMGLGKCSGLVLMMASGFSAPSFPQDNTEAAGTYPSLELHSTCAAMQHFWEAAEGVCLWQQGRSAGGAWLHIWARGAASPAQGQGWAALVPMLVSPLPTPAALNLLSQEPQVFCFALAFGS